jgi:hypothetical protein
MRSSAHRRWKALGDGSFTYRYVLADDRIALPERTGSNEDVVVRCGADS